MKKNALEVSKLEIWIPKQQAIAHSRSSSTDIACTSITSCTDNRLPQFANSCAGTPEALAGPVSRSPSSIANSRRSPKSGLSSVRASWKTQSSFSLLFWCPWDGLVGKRSRSWSTYGAYADFRYYDDYLHITAIRWVSYLRHRGGGFDFPFYVNSLNYIE